MFLCHQSRHLHSQSVSSGGMERGVDAQKKPVRRAVLQASVMVIKEQRSETHSGGRDGGARIINNAPTPPGFSDN